MNTEIETATIVRNVDYLERPGIGRVYRAIVTVALLATLLRKAVVRYSPLYQRGFRRPVDDPSAYEVLLEITNPTLNIDRRRAEAMAVKYLKGQFYNTEVVWNARAEDDSEPPKFNKETESLSISSSITIPDSAHRHLAYYFLDQWKRDPKAIPAAVTVDDAPVPDDEIRSLLKEFDPRTANVFVQIYTVSPELEGWLYDQLNFDQKPPQRAVGITLNPLKTPARRFVDALMRKSQVFSDREVETRANNIGTDSRKLTTNSTLVGAVQEFTKLLLKLEQESTKTGAYTDFIEFVAAFFEEYAKHFPEVQPGASGEDRNSSRKTAFAISNIMFHPLMRLAKDLWLAYRRDKRPWAKHPEWRDAIARLAGATAKRKSIKVMDRANPDWMGKILIETYGPTGVTGTTLSNTRQTREAAYQYLLEVSRIAEFVNGAASADDAGEPKATPGRRGRARRSA